MVMRHVRRVAGRPQPERQRHAGQADQGHDNEGRWQAHDRAEAAGKWVADEPTGALDSKSSAALLDVFDTINASGQTILMVTHSTSAASRAQRVLFIKDGILYNQIFKGDKSEHQMFQEISDTLTVMASEVN